MPVHAWFSGHEGSLAPGDTLTLTLTVHNLGDDTASYTILPAGLAAPWTAVSHSSLTLFAGSQQTIDVDVAPPAVPSTIAGPTTIAARVMPLTDTDDSVSAEATVVIEPFDGLRLVPLQPIQRARRRAQFEFMAENHGNTIASCRLHLVDPTGRVDGDFDPPSIGVTPGASSLVLLNARARRGLSRRRTRVLDFEVEAARLNLGPASTALSFVQSPTITGGTLRRAAAVLAVVATVVAGWLAVIEPAIDDAAASSVDDAITELTADQTPDGTSRDATVTSSLPVEIESSPDEATPTFFRLPVDAPLTQTADQSTTMAEGEIFDMTDVLIENPFNDRGVATLLVNGDTVFVWSLENVRGTFFVPSITPIRLDPGDNVTFSVRCDEIGESNRSTCTNAINVGGETRPVDDG